MKYIFFHLFVFSHLICNTTMGQMPDISQDQTESQSGSKEKLEGAKALIKDCHNAHKIVELIAQDKWTQLAQYLPFPVKRKFPLTAVTKEMFSENPKLLFDDKSLASNAEVKSMGSYGCMVDNGFLWIQFDSEGGKISKINNESKLSTQQRVQESQVYLETLPKEYQNADVIFTCKTSKSVYTVFKKINSTQYYLQKKKNDEVTDLVTNGVMRIEGSLRARYYRFSEEGTTLTFSESVRFDGYNIEAKQGEKVLYIECH